MYCLVRKKDLKDIFELYFYLLNENPIFVFENNNLHLLLEFNFEYQGFKLKYGNTVVILGMQIYN